MIYKSRSYLAYLQPQALLLGNMPRIKRHVVKKIRYHLP